MVDSSFSWFFFVCAFISGCACGYSIAKLRKRSGSKVLQAAVVEPTPLDRVTAFSARASALLSLMQRYRTPFSLAIVRAASEMDPYEGQRARNRSQPRSPTLDKLVRHSIREQDYSFELDGGRVAILMPHCDLTEAVNLVKRLRKEGERQQLEHFCAGVIEALDGDTEDSLLGRSTQALADAEASWEFGAIHIHDGTQAAPWVDETFAKSN